MHVDIGVARGDRNSNTALLWSTARIIYDPK